MSRLAPVFCLLLFGFVSASAADYGGKVGKLDAVFSLEWHADGRVTGTYSHPSRPGVAYALRGSNPAEGELYLEEFTGSRLTAKCYLSKSIAGKVVIWKGEMQNTDGRRLPMSFSRATSAPAPVPVSAPSDQGSKYYGFVGRLDAEFSLVWHEDGSVSGSYHYPQRPGTVYTLRGFNAREGELSLAEFTGGTLTARCLLAKRLEAGAIVWEGVMMNTDGRRFPMSLARERARQGGAPAAVDYEAKRRSFLAGVETEIAWNDFPLAEEPVDLVPAHLEEGEYFGARVEAIHHDLGRSELVLLVADWDPDGRLMLDEARRLNLHVARELPLPADRMVGCEISLLFAPDGSLFSVELADIAVTHVRKDASGKFEVRGTLDFYRPGVRPEAGTPEFAEEMRRAPVADFLPDKIALDRSPADAALDEGDEIWFQTVRLVRDYGIVVQATAAGPGSLELEAIALEPEENPWISLKDVRQPIKAPPSQYTNQAG